MLHVTSVTSLDTLPEIVLPMTIKKVKHNLGIDFKESLYVWVGFLADSCLNLISDNLKD